VTLYEVEATQGTGKSWSLSVWDGAKANAKSQKQLNQDQEQVCGGTFTAGGCGKLGKVTTWRVAGIFCRGRARAHR
jgi:hypothetical protein